MKKSAKKNNTIQSSIKNRRASYDYALEDDFKFGVVLSGRQVRAVRTNHISLTGSYVTIKDNELWLVNAKLTLPKSSKEKEVLTQTEPIKLLATKKELKFILNAKNSGRTLVPTEMLNKTRYIKLRASIGKGKKEYDKRETKKKREFERQSKRDLKNL